MLIRASRTRLHVTKLTLAGFASLVVFVNVAAPKGGIYIGSIPITWGYVLLGLGALFVSLRLLTGHYKINAYEAYQIIFFAIFQHVTLYAYCGSASMITTQHQPMQSPTLLPS